MKPVTIIGMGLSPRDLTSAHLEQIKAADILIGGKRHLEYFKDSPARKKEIDKNLKAVIQYIKDWMNKASIVVLASGDPLFFGIGSFMIRSLGAENVRIHANVTSVAAAFSRIREPWQDAHVVSIHGRLDTKALSDALGQKDKIAVFTDPERNPAWLANVLLEKGMNDFKMCVLEQLGTDAENVGWYDPDQVAAREFSEPNLVILRRAPSQEKDTSHRMPLHLGMADELYEHQRGLITKAEVRAVTLSKLCLSSSDLILWDLGAGSGSIAIEAALFIKKGRIIAVEQNADRIEQIRNNKKQFDINNLEIIHSTLPNGLEALPKPDRIFIGGGGRHLREIISVSAACLRPGGIMVINTVLIQTLDTAISSLKKMGFETEFVQVQISRSQEMPWGERLEAQNPVWVISGLKHES